MRDSSAQTLVEKSCYIIMLTDGYIPFTTFRPPERVFKKRYNKLSFLSHSLLSHPTSNIIYGAICRCDFIHLRIDTVKCIPPKAKASSRHIRHDVVSPARKLTSVTPASSLAIWQTEYKSRDRRVLRQNVLILVFNACSVLYWTYDVCGFDDIGQRKAVVES